jgi:hypothetical protein
MLVVIVWNASGLVSDDARHKVRFLLMFVNTGKRVRGTDPSTAERAPICRRWSMLKPEDFQLGTIKGYSSETPCVTCLSSLSFVALSDLNLQR